MEKRTSSFPTGSVPKRSAASVWCGDDSWGIKNSLCKKPDGFGKFVLQPAHPQAAWEPVALVGFYGFFVEKIRKNYDYWASFRSLQGKKSPFSRFFGVLCASATNSWGMRLSQNFSFWESLECPTI
jgi:hypothetical protein